MTDPNEIDKLRQKIDEAARSHESTKSGYISAEDISLRKRQGWRIKDMVPKKGLCIVWGPPGSGKSFFMLDMACAIARGLPSYHGKRIRPGVVIYLAMEGNLQDRIEAYRAEHRLRGGELSDLYIKHSTVNFMDEASVLAECAAIKDLIGDREVAAVVIDTLARSMPGGNENGSEAMGAIIGGFKFVEDYFQTVVIPLHHCGKDTERGMRGHSSLLGAIDAEIEIRRNGDDPVRTLHIGKQKDGQDHYDLMNFRLKQIELGPTSRWDEDAEPHEVDTSCVLVSTDEEASGPSKDKPKGKVAAKFDQALEQCMSETGNNQREDVKQRFYMLHTGKPEAKRQAFNRAWDEYMANAVKTNLNEE